MITFNRVVLIFLCLALIVAAVAIIVLTWTIPNRTINWLADAVQWMDDNDGDLEKALLTTVSASVGLIAMIVLLIELIPRRGPGVKVSGLNRGNATLSTAAIGQRIEEAVCQVPNVSEVKANVTSKKNGVLVSLDLQVDPEANLATVTDEACQVAEDVLENRVHVSLLKPPTARLHYRELRLQGRNGARRTTSAPSVPVSPPPETISAPVAVGAARGSAAVASAPPEPPDLPDRLAHQNGEALAGPVGDNGDEEKTS
jgi:hypothetical protein